MLSINNILKPQDGKPVVTPTQDMVLGCYYLTIEREGEKGEGKFFSSPEEALLAYEMGEIGLHALINVRMTKTVDGKMRHGTIKTTMGRLIFNEGIPQDLGYVDRSKEENLFELELNTLVDKSKLGDIVDRCYRLHGTTVTAEVLDKIKRKDTIIYKVGITIGVTILRCLKIRKRFCKMMQG